MNRLLSCIPGFLIQYTSTSTAAPAVVLNAPSSTFPDVSSRALETAPVADALPSRHQFNQIRFVGADDGQAVARRHDGKFAASR